MEYVLVDIKNFLKKLESGQLEIEAGQWELHKAMSSMNKVITDIKNLREDVEDMKMNSLEQMGLIKELQMHLDKLNKSHVNDQPVTVSESSVEYERVYKRPTEGQATAKGFKKRKCRIRSEEIIEITSQMSNDKSESGVEESAPRADQCPREGDRTEFETTINEQISDDESSQNDYKTEPYNISKNIPTKCHYGTHTANNDMLQRYLKDSIKYIEGKASDSTQITHNSSHNTEVHKTNSTEYTPFWDEYSSRGPPETHCEKQVTKVVKENPPPAETPAENIPPKRYICYKCPKKYIPTTGILRRERKRRVAETKIYYCRACGKGFGSRDRLKEHEVAHKVTRSFKGFRCSYCSKICSSPEKLTSHLRNCRLIMKTHYNR